MREKTDPCFITVLWKAARLSEKERQRDIKSTKCESGGENARLSKMEYGLNVEHYRLSGMQEENEEEEQRQQEQRTKTKEEEQQEQQEEQPTTTKKKQKTKCVGGKQNKSKNKTKTQNACKFGCLMSLL